MVSTGVDAKVSSAGGGNEPIELECCQTLHMELVSLLERQANYYCPILAYCPIGEFMPPSGMVLFR